MSRSRSPARKRQRLSSPTYDNEIDNLTQADLDAFDEINARLSQDFRPPIAFNLKGSGFNLASNVLGQRTSSPGRTHDTASPPLFKFASDKQSPMDHDPENPFSGGFASAASISNPVPTFQPPTLLGFASASKLKLPITREEYRSPSPEAPPPEPDYDSWFKPIPIDAPPVFETAKFSLASAEVGFMKASTKSVLVPSAQAFEKARTRLQAWEAEGEENVPMAQNVGRPSTSSPFQAASTLNQIQIQSPKRPALSTVENVVQSPERPASAGFSRPSIVPNPATSSPITLHRPKPFKSPLIKTSYTPNRNVGSPLNPNRTGIGMNMNSSTRFQQPHPLSNTPITLSPALPHQAPSNPALFVTPIRPVQRSRDHHRTTPAPFITPFKPGMKPGEAGRIKLDTSNAAKTPRLPDKSTLPKENQNWLTRERPPCDWAKQTFFCLTPTFARQSLSSNLHPEQFTTTELESMGINVRILSQISPETALYYSFHTFSSALPTPTFSNPSTVLGPAEAFKELLDRGCTLATKPWVDNHWCLILWKLAGLVMLDPEKEANPDEKRWCWREVIRQLLYRYERELNSGSRPALRKISTQDAPAAFPMTLCISNITWSPAQISEDGKLIEAHPQLEVTDGWYRLRANIDIPMAKAVRKGIIRVGRKIGVAGARLSTEKKDPMEILEAYNSTKLILSGNSSQLMPWDAKLGFMRGPCISTLHSLSPGGGLVTAADLVVVKTHPVAFFEFIEEEDGQKRKEGPRGQAEEAGLNEQWKRRREVEASKLQSALDKKLSRYEAYIDRLESKAGSGFHPGEDDCAPDNIDSYYDELEYPENVAKVIASVTPKEAGWLARHIRKQLEVSRESVGDEIEQELKTLCPPRSVRSFRILFMQDAQTIRRPSHRIAVVTIWDVLGLTVAEGGKPGEFRVGQRYLITNLMPTHLGSWMGYNPGSEVYLMTRPNTRWTPIATAMS